MFVVREVSHSGYRINSFEVFEHSNYNTCKHWIKNANNKPSEKLWRNFQYLKAFASIFTLTILLIFFGSINPNGLTVEMQIAAFFFWLFLQAIPIAIIGAIYEAVKEANDFAGASGMYQIGEK